MRLQMSKATYAGLVVVAGAIATTIVVLAPSAGADSTDKKLAKAGTSAFATLDAAKSSGYALLKDAKGIACIDNPGVGAMGIHYVKGDLVKDPTVAAKTPAVLVYQPLAGGQMQLVAVEYVVIAQAWKDAGNANPPKLFGKDFELIPAGNRYGLPPFYELHAWLYKHNSRGMYDDWNPTVSCAAA